MKGGERSYDVYIIISCGYGVQRVRRQKKREHADVKKQTGDRTKNMRRRMRVVCMLYICKSKEFERDPLRRADRALIVKYVIPIE